MLTLKEEKVNMLRRFVFLLVLLLAGFSLTGFSAPLSTAAEGEGTPWWMWLLIILILVAFALLLYWWWRRGGSEQGKEEAAHPAEPKEAAHTPAAQIEMAQAPEPVPPVARVEEVAAAPMAPLEAVPPAVRVEEVTAARMAPPTPDDLERIEGIGPKISSVLQAAGITTFAQLAETEVDRIKQILGEANPNLLRLADPTTWPEQAKLAAEGKWDEFQRLQDGLKGGRRA
jgi:predicted flap endonuclease-1-like 5' DNA nuclease